MAKDNTPDPAPVVDKQVRTVPDDQADNVSGDLKGEIANMEAQIDKIKNMPPALTPITDDTPKDEKDQLKPIEPLKPPEPTEEPPVSKYQGKTSEELAKILQDKEAFEGKRSNEIGNLKKQIEDYKATDEKLTQLEKSTYQFQKGQIPKKPEKQMFYDNPEDYFDALDKYNEARINAIAMPLQERMFNLDKKSFIEKMRYDTRDEPIKYEEVEADVEAELKKRPELFKRYGWDNARKVVYDELKNQKLPSYYEKQAEEKIRKQIEAETKRKQRVSNAYTEGDTPVTNYEGSRPARIEDIADDQKAVSAYEKKIRSLGGQV